MWYFPQDTDIKYIIPLIKQFYIYPCQPEDDGMRIIEVL